METQGMPASTMPKSNKTWLIVGAIVLVCCCITILAAVVAGPAIMTVFNSVSKGGGLYSGRADEQLRADVLNAITQYETTANGCSDVSLFLGQVIIAPEQSSDGSWSEMWQVKACDASHVYSISFVPSPGGGTDFSVTKADQ